MKVPVELLVVICVAVGIAPALTVAPVLHAAAASILGSAMPEYSRRYGTASTCRWR